MTNALTTTELRVIPFFSEFSDVQADWLLERREVFSQTENSLIYAEGNPSNAFWLLVKGEWEMVRRVRGVSEPLVYRSDKPGTWHGGVALIDTIAPASARAESQPRPARPDGDDATDGGVGLPCGAAPPGGRARGRKDARGDCA